MLMIVGPIDMVLHCPKCHVQHIDAPAITVPEDTNDMPAWTNPPHRSHLCHNCLHVWRPCDLPTNGGREDRDSREERFMSERWEPIPRYLGKYEVSDRGRIRSLDRVITRLNRWGDVKPARLKGKILKPQSFSNGYLFVVLGRGGGASLLHRLVAKAFVPGYRPGLQVNHLDGVRWHNDTTNLQWLTCGDNHRHSYRELERKTHARTRRVRVGRRVFESVNDASRHLGVTSGSVSSAARGPHRCQGQKVSYV